MLYAQVVSLDRELDVIPVAFPEIGFDLVDRPNRVRAAAGLHGGVADTVLRRDRRHNQDFRLIHAVKLLRVSS